MEYTPPSFCHACGHPYPWTKTKLEVAELITLESEELKEERDSLISLLPDLISDTPKTKLAALRWKQALAKVKDVSAIALREIFVEIASETAKKLLFPNG